MKTALSFLFLFLLILPLQSIWAADIFMSYPEEEKELTSAPKQHQNIQTRSLDSKEKIDFRQANEDLLVSFFIEDPQNQKKILDSLKKNKIKSLSQLLESLRRSTESDDGFNFLPESLSIRNPTLTKERQTDINTSFLFFLIHYHSLPTRMLSTIFDNPKKQNPLFKNLNLNALEEKQIRLVALSIVYSKRNSISWKKMGSVILLLEAIRIGIYGLEASIEQLQFSAPYLAFILASSEYFNIALQKRKLAKILKTHQHLISTSPVCEHFLRKH